MKIGQVLALGGFAALLLAGLARGLIGDGTGETRLGNAELRAEMAARLADVYAAFGQEDEGAVFDGLAAAVSTDLAPGLYLQQRRALLAEAEDGGETEILSVEFGDWVRLPGPGNRARATWSVHARISHEVHVHERLNSYSAVLSLGREDGVWKLTDLAVEDITRSLPEEPEFFDDFN